MARSKETFNKKDKEKKRLKQKQEKMEKMQERKANASKKSLEEMMAYVDEDGNLSSTPPDPKKRKVFNADEIQIAVPKYENNGDEDETRTGTVVFFNESKGFGFINDSQTGERVFVHVNNITERIDENDQVSFEVMTNEKGYNAINVKKTKPK